MGNWLREPRNLFFLACLFGPVIAVVLSIVIARLLST